MGPSNESWRTGAFVRTWATAFLVLNGYWIIGTSLQWHVATLPGASPGDVGLLYFITLLPMLVLTPLVGPLMDRLSRKQLLLTSTAVSVVAAGAGAAVAAADGLSLLAAQLIAAAMGLVMAVNSPGFQSFVPSTVAPAHLRQAVSVYAAGQNTARTLGPVIAAVLLLTGSTVWPLLAVAVVGVGAMILLWSVPDTKRVRTGSASIVADLTEGFRTTFAEPVIRRAVLLVALNGFIGLSYASMLPVVANDLVKTDQLGFSIILAAGGIGSVAGAVMRYPRVHAPHQILWLLLPMAAGMVVLAFSSSLLPAAAASLVLSLCGVAIMVKLNVLIQGRLSDAIRGRVMSIYSWAWGGSLPIGGLALGFVSTHFSLQLGLLVAAMLLVAIGVVNWLWRVRAP